MAAIPRSTRQGKRDYALFSIAVYTGRPVSAICKLRFGDLQRRDQVLWINWPGDEHPQPAHKFIWDGITDFLEANGQLGSIQSDDYIFTALTERATHLPNVPVATWDSSQPLSPNMVARLIKKYARRAGLDPKHITPKTLQYTAAAQHASLGAPPQLLADWLNYGDPYTFDKLYRNLVANASPPWQNIDTYFEK